MAECQVKSADRDQIQLDSRPLPTRAVSDGASRNKPNLCLMMEAGMAQQRPVWISPATELCSLDLGPPAAVLLCPWAEGEPMGEVWVAEATDGNRKLGEAGPGFLEVMVGNRGCQGCSFWVTQLWAPVCVIAVSRVGCSGNECLPLLL